MKKIYSFLICIFVLFACISCDEKNANEKFMPSGSLSNQSTKEIDNYQLENMIQNEEDFVLLIELKTCSSCLSFKSNVLNKYIEETHATIYSIEMNQLNNYKNYENKPYVKTAPTILIYNSGEKYASLDYSKNEKEFKEIEKFKTFMDEYILLPKIVEISEELLDKKITNSESFILYIGWNKCGDCKSLENNVLNNYLKEKSSSMIIYYLESDLYRINKPISAPNKDEFETEEDYNVALNHWNKWIAFATKYNFVSYQNGKVPSIQYYEQGNLKEMVVYLNDVIEENKIIHSYYPELINKSLNNDELMEYHNNKVLEFLNKYYK